MKSLLCWGKGEGERHTLGQAHFFPCPKTRLETTVTTFPEGRNKLLDSSASGKPPGSPNASGDLPWPRREDCALRVYFLALRRLPRLFSSFPGIPLPQTRVTHPDLRPSPGLQVSREAAGRGVSREARLGTPPPRPFPDAPRIRKENRTVLNKKKSELFGQEATVVLECPGTLGMGGGPVSPFPFR